MSRWFRFYDEALDDPKVQRLPPNLFRTWVNLLCLASESGGKLPERRADIAFRLRMSPDDCEHQIDELIMLELIDIGGDGLAAPHNWDKRQFKSDDSAERVKKYRDRRAASGLARGASYTKHKPDIEARDGTRCAYCGAGSANVIEHMVPTSRGGTDDLDNLCMACKPCNSAKAGRLPVEARMTFLVATAYEAHQRFLLRVTPTEQPVTEPVTLQNQNRSETEPESKTEQTREPRAKSGFDLKVFSGSEVPAVEPELLRRAEGLGLNSKAIEGECFGPTVKNPSAYFQSLCRKRLREMVPGISDDVIGRGLCGDLKAYGTLMDLIMMVGSAR